MDEYFEKIMEFIFKWEGGYVNDPDDTGGETNFGISKRSHPDIDIKNLTKEQAKEIYKKEYWCFINPEEHEYHPEIAMFIMDTAVNMGKSFAKELKEFCHFDSVTNLLLYRIERYIEISRQKKYLKYLRGWINRVIDLYYFIGEVTNGDFQ